MIEEKGLETRQDAGEYLLDIPLWTRKKNTLKQVGKLLEALGSPDRGLQMIHVAGTNGKGSVCGPDSRAGPGRIPDRDFYLPPSGGYPGADSSGRGDGFPGGFPGCF